jgi:hypothetical protein
MNIKKILFNLFMTHVAMNILAQEVISTAGNTASGSGGSVSYTVGQVFYTTNSGTSGSVSQGVQQPFEISVITFKENAKGISLSYLVFPNPTTDYLILKIEGEIQTQCIASLYDINGKLIENKKVNGNLTNIATSNLVPATYFLKLTNNGMEIKSFKIIKH